MQLRSNSSGVLVALGMAVALSGCANVDFDSEQAWFSKPFDLFGRKGGYTFSELQETKQRQRPINANDLVNANGTCAPRPAPKVAAPAAGGQAATPAASGDTDRLLGGGVALGMSECDVVYRAGPPSSVEIGKNANGDRTAVLTYNGGLRPGIYHFEHGALAAMDRIAAPAAPAPQVAKKKSAKSAKSTKPQKKNET